MTQRENLLALLRRQPYEFVPAEFMLCPSLIEDYRREENQPEMPYEDYFQLPWRRVGDLVPDDTDLTRFEKYHEGRLNERVQALHKRGIASVGNMQCTIWETSWYIRGMENLMMDMMTDEEMAAAILGRVAAMSTQRALLYANAGCDILFLGDDIGMQRSIMMSRELYNQWIQPRLKKLIAQVKAVRPDIIVFYHSCGFIEPLIDDLIDAGIDVLNPIQSECMDFGEIYAKYHDRLVFHGTIGTQTVMPFGTPEEVRAEVWKNLDIAKEGGLFVAPTHLLEPEVPWQNIRAYVQACRDYPLHR